MEVEQVQDYIKVEKDENIIEDVVSGKWSIFKHMVDFGTKVIAETLNIVYHSSNIYINRAQIEVENRNSTFIISGGIRRAGCGHARIKTILIQATDSSIN
ncbi:hypothetical protein CHS0354_032669 [Potamilus streckersoni]|uniref:Uncharacterized protein n=1 Tax=Potamilus streckersoni TaxID=2493646 RepID=A0AAE0TGC5_9BIVA|nr:hypothetical protein CHS0354_032669 [Potamilus streckersoni]